MHCIRQFPQNDIPVFSSNTQYYAHFFINLDFVLQIELRDINLVGGGYNFGVLTAPASRGVDSTPIKFMGMYSLLLLRNTLLVSRLSCFTIKLIFYMSCKYECLVACVGVALNYFIAVFLNYFPLGESHIFFGEGGRWSLYDNCHPDTSCRACSNCRAIK